MLTRNQALAIYHAGPQTVVRVLLAWTRASTRWSNRWWN